MPFIRSPYFLILRVWVPGFSARPENRGCREGFEGPFGGLVHERRHLPCASRDEKVVRRTTCWSVYDLQLTWCSCSILKFNPEFLDLRSHVWGIRMSFYEMASLRSWLTFIEQSRIFTRCRRRILLQSAFDTQPSNCNNIDECTICGIEPV